MQTTPNQRLKFLREKQKFSQQAFADAIGLTSQGYSSIERGRTKITLQQIETLTETFSLDKDYILNGDETKNESQLIVELKTENKSLRQQVSDLMAMIKELTNSVNMLSQKLGKLEGKPLIAMQTSLKKVA